MIKVNLNNHNDVVNNKIFDIYNRCLRDVRISVTDRCNFRCIYCMPTDFFYIKNKFLNNIHMLSFEEILRSVKIFSSLGVKKIRFTGGEPLMRVNFCKLVESIKHHNINIKLALTTNGVLLFNYAKQLKDAGLDQITISLNSLDNMIFKQLSGNKNDMDKVYLGINAAEEAGFLPLKINVVVLKGINDVSILNLVRYFKGSGHIVRFIEFMDVGNYNNWQKKYVVISTNILKKINSVMPIRKIARNYISEVSERFSYFDGSGEIGFISSISKPFCKFCSRLRLSSDGKIYTCLFGSNSYNLKAQLRSTSNNEIIKKWIYNVWLMRNNRYSELREQVNDLSNKAIEMHQIGG